MREVSSFATVGIGILILMYCRCLRDGKIESEGMSWEESIVIMETLDQVRKQGGVVYPEKIETTEYPVSL